MGATDDPHCEQGRRDHIWKWIQLMMIRTEGLWGPSEDLGPWISCLHLLQKVIHS